MTLHSFEIETISDMDWEGIRQCSDILRNTTARPSKRAVNAANGNFLVEIGNSDDRGELVRRCVFVTSKRSTLITLADAPGGKYRTSWKAWEGIQESEIASLNSELLSAVASLYGFTEGRLVQGVTNNPHNPPSEIPKETLLKAFDTQVFLWFETKRLRLLSRHVDELKKGKESIFMWRFYWTKWKGAPTYTAIDSNLIGLLSAYLRHPNHLKTLLEHLDGGGDGFSEDTKQVLVHLRSTNGV